MNCISRLSESSCHSAVQHGASYLNSNHLPEYQQCRDNVVSSHLPADYNTSQGFKSFREFVFPNTCIFMHAQTSSSTASSQGWKEHCFSIVVPDTVLRNCILCGPRASAVQQCKACTKDSPLSNLRQSSRQRFRQLRGDISLNSFLMPLDLDHSSNTEVFINTQ